jgi:high-affinity K+ transport system ATPase subunit B
MLTVLSGRSRPISAGWPIPSHVKRLEVPGDRLSAELTLADHLAEGDCVLCVPGDVIARNGEVVDGEAVVHDGTADSLDRPACRSLVIGSVVEMGCHVISGFVVVRVDAKSA